MTKVAAEVADGMIMHPFSSAKYIREVTLPAIAAGLERSGRTLSNFELDYAPIVATGVNEASIRKAREIARDRIAFYGSTEAYKPVLDIHGWGDLQVELNRMNKRQQQKEMAALIDDEILETIAIVGTPEEVIDAMRTRFSDVVGRTGFRVPALSDEYQTELLNRLRQK